MTTSSIGTYISLYTEDAETGPWWIQPQYESTIDAAVSFWIDSGCTRDTLLDLTTMDGFNFRVKASRIGSWALNTPEGRRRRLELLEQAEVEERMIRQELGIWREDD